jgi:hypothetical protein
VGTKRCRSSSSGGKSSRGKRKRPSGSSSTPAGPPATNSSSSSNSGWDAFKSRKWHPQFDVSTVSLEQLLTAVQQQQQQLQRSSTAAAAAPSAALQQQALVARPPRTMARSRACTGCEALSPEAFLGHLQTLSWYQQQVRQSDCASSICQLSAQPRTRCIGRTEFGCVAFT